MKRERILEAGLEVMKAQGYHGTSVNDIVAAAGIPKGSFYNYFQSKEDFAVAAIEQVACTSLKASESALHTGDQSAVARLRNFFSDQADDCGQQGFKVGCFLGNMSQEMADGNEAIRKVVNAALQEQTGLIRSILDQGKAAGEVDTDVDTQMLAEFLFNAWEGALLKMKATKSRAPLEAFIQQFQRAL